MLHWSSVDTVMLDMDGTLLDLHFDNYFWLQLVPREYGRINGLTPGNALQVIRARYAQVQGTLDWYCLDYWERELQLGIMALKQRIRHKITLRPNAGKLLQKLQGSGKRVVLVTNAHPSSLQLKMRHTGIADCFHRRISSHSLKLAKENPGFWERLRTIEPYEPQRTVLFDDSVPVLRQARREGIEHLFAIGRPDSQRPRLEPAGFPQVEDFDDLFASSGTNP